MACNSCEPSGQPAGLPAQVQPQGQSKPLALGQSDPSGMASQFTQPGAGLNYSGPGMQQSPTGGQSEHDKWLAMPASSRQFMPEPGSADANYMNDQAAQSNAIFASQGNNDPWATFARPMQSGSGAPNQYVASSPFTAQAPAAPTTGGAAPYAPDAGTGYQQGTQALNGPYGNVQTTLNNSNVPTLQSGQALLDMLNQSRDAAYKQNTAYLDPQFANQEQALRSQLANQGIPQGSEAFTKAMDDFGRQKEFAYGQARSGAIGQGNAAQNQLFGQGLAANQNQFGQNLSAGQFGNAAQNQYAQQLLQQMGYGTQYGIAQMGNQLGNRSLDEQINQNNFNNSMGMRNQDINELLLQQQNPLQLLNMLMSGQNVQSPNFSQTPGSNMANTDIAGIIGQNTAQNNNIYNTQVGAQNSQNAGLTGLAGSALAAFMMF